MPPKYHVGPYSAARHCPRRLPVRQKIGRACRAGAGWGCRSPCMGTEGVRKGGWVHWQGEGAASSAIPLCYQRAAAAGGRCSRRRATLVRWKIFSGDECKGDSDIRGVSRETRISAAFQGRLGYPRRFKGDSDICGVSLGEGCRRGGRNSNGLLPAAGTAGPWARVSESRMELWAHRYGAARQPGSAVTAWLPLGPGAFIGSHATARLSRLRCESEGPCPSHSRAALRAAHPGGPRFSGCLCPSLFLALSPTLPLPPPPPSFCLC